MVRTLGISRGRQEKNTVGILVLGSLVFQGVNFLLILLLFGAYLALAGKEPPVMMQMQGGEAIAMSPMDSRERTPATIQKFTQETMTLLLSASGRIPVPEGSPMVDPGVEVRSQSNRKIATLANLASFGLSEDFRVPFLEELSKYTPQDVFARGGSVPTQQVLVIQDLSLPQPIKAGEWKVTMIANLITVSPEYPMGRPTKFNREIFIRAVPPMVNAPLSSDLEKQIAGIRQGGLEIYGIRPYIPPQNIR